MAVRVLFQQKIVEDKKRKAISMGLKRMLLKLNPKHHQTTEKTLNSKWILGCAQKATGSSSTAGFGEHLADATDNLNVFAALTLFYAVQEEPNEAGVAGEKDNASLADASPCSVLEDTCLERSFMDAVIRCGRPEIEKTLLDVPSSGLAKNVTMIRKDTDEKNLASAKAVFEAATSWRRRPEQLRPQRVARRARETAPAPRT